MPDCSCTCILTVSLSLQVWDSSTGDKLFRCDGISDNSQESILCVNISGDNTRLIASASNGRIAVRAFEAVKKASINLIGSKTLPMLITYSDILCYI